MNDVKFQLILREPVDPEHFILRKLKELIDAKQNEIGDYDVDFIRNTIRINYYIEYPNVKRQILSFNANLSILEPLGLNGIKEFVLDFGNSFRSYPFVEGVFRYEDDYVVSEIVKLHLEIYSVEQKVRDVLFYILALNLPDNPIFDFVGEFEGPKILNNNIRTNKEYRETTWTNYLENDLFYISFTDYGYFCKPKSIEPKNLLNIILKSDDFSKLKERILKRGICGDLNESHVNFVTNLSVNLDPIEKLRNEIMHNRVIKDITSYRKAKEQILSLIDEFWNEEMTRTVNQSKKIMYVIETIYNSITKEGDYYKFFNLDLEEQISDSKEELINQIVETLTYRFGDVDFDLAPVIEEKIQSLE